MTVKIKNAVLLAAGLGTRLRPLTLTTPKPLLPLDGGFLIDHQLRYLANAGIEEIAINLHHLGEKIRGHVGDGARYGVKVHYSPEPEILGTGGGIKKAAAVFGSANFVALNCDALIDADLSELFKHHEDSGAVATMVLMKLRDGDEFKPVSVDSKGMVTGFGSGTHFYTGLQVLTPRAIDVLPPAGKVSCLIEDGYKKMLSTSIPVSAFVHKGYFNDLGTPERYEKARKDIRDGSFKLL